MTTYHRGQHFPRNELPPATPAVENRSVLVGESVELPMLASWAVRTEAVRNLNWFEPEFRAATHAVQRLGYVHCEAIVATGGCNGGATIAADARGLANEAATCGTFVAARGLHDSPTASPVVTTSSSWFPGLRAPRVWLRTRVYLGQSPSGRFDSHWVFRT